MFYENLGRVTSFSQCSLEALSRSPDLGVHRRAEATSRIELQKNGPNTLKALDRVQKWRLPFQGPDGLAHGPNWRRAKR